MLKISGNKVHHDFYYNPGEISSLNSKINTWVEKAIAFCAIFLLLFWGESYTGLDDLVKLIITIVIIALCVWIYYKYQYRFNEQLYEEHSKVLDYLKKYEID
ncbi:MAG: hypothetical protein IT268_09365 [Saprospiraceae bacterium]|nr:hypothetical protein [Saprospiraceae bacterium]